MRSKIIGKSSPVRKALSIYHQSRLTTFRSFTRSSSSSSFNKTIPPSYLGILGVTTLLGSSYALWKHKQSSFMTEFKIATNYYLTENQIKDIYLSENELIQLSWHIDNKVTTPEQREPLQADDLNTEIKRGIARVYCFELLFKPDLRESYEEFVKDQPTNSKLSFEDFQTLVMYAKQLTEDQRKIIRASCFLTKSNYLDELLVQKQLTSPKDSEEFLSWLVTNPEASQCVPIMNMLTESQQESLAYAFWHHAHFRHMLFTEGGGNMFSSLRQGIKEGKLDQQAFMLWSWRWLTNLMGFHGHQGQGAKFLDKFVFQDTILLMAELQKLFDDPDYPILDNFLLKKAQRCGLDQNKRIIGNEIQLVAHLIAFVPEIVGQLGYGDIIDGYVTYRDTPSGGNSTLPNGYQDFCGNENIQTPTYTPAILRSAYKLLKNKFKVDRPLKDATEFSCQVLDFLYQQKLDHIVSCRNLAWVETLEPILERWLANNKEVTFHLDNNEISDFCNSPPAPRPF